MGQMYRPVRLRYGQTSCRGTQGKRTREVTVALNRRAVVAAVFAIAMVATLSACATTGVNTSSAEMKSLRAATTKHLNLVTTLTVPLGMKRLSASVIDSCASTPGQVTRCAISRADVYSVEVAGSAMTNAAVVDTLFDSSGFTTQTPLVGTPELAAIANGDKVIATDVTKVSGVTVRAQFMPSGMPKDLLALRLASVPTHGGTILRSSGANASTRIAKMRDTTAPYLVVIDYSEEYYPKAPAAQ
jgi:hypothetical protein